MPVRKAAAEALKRVDPAAVDVAGLRQRRRLL
jgi:hypothetical protein